MLIYFKSGIATNIENIRLRQKQKKNEYTAT